MGLNYRYEAWRNFLLILASILVADALANFAEIRKSFLSFVDFDKSMNTYLWPNALAALTVIYVIKNAHGVLITLFDESYFNMVKSSRLHVMVSCLLTGLVIISFSLVTHLGKLIENGYDVSGRGWRLMLLGLGPTLILLAFDGFHIRIGSYRSSGRWNFLLEVLKELCRNPLARRSHQEFKRVWIAEGVFSLLLLGAWFLSIRLIREPEPAIWITLGTLATVLFVNSIADYILNFNYFFFVEEPHPSGSNIAGPDITQGQKPHDVFSESALLDPLPERVPEKAPPKQAKTSRHPPVTSPRQKGARRK